VPRTDVTWLFRFRARPRKVLSLKLVVHVSSLNCHLNSRLGPRTDARTIRDMPGPRTDDRTIRDMPGPPLFNCETVDLVVLLRTLYATDDDLLLSSSLALS